MLTIGVILLVVGVVGVIAYLLWVTADARQRRAAVVPAGSPVDRGPRWVPGLFFGSGLCAIVGILLIIIHVITSG
jgi:hypothetical protein